jgi:hypothetical protein
VHAEYIKNNKMERVICICKFRDDSTEGMGKILEMDNPFVKKYLYPGIDEEGERIGAISAHNPMIFISSGQISYAEFEDWQVLLVLDDYLVSGKEQLEPFLDGNTLVMHHSIPYNMHEYLKGQPVKGSKQGYHEKGDQYGYPLLNNLFGTYTESGFNPGKYHEALKKIIAWFFFDGENDDLLEAKLDFLHQCLTPEGLVNATLNPEWNAGKEFSALMNSKDGPFGDNYINALKELRNKLID